MPPLSGMRVLVTGGTGFIGSHLVEGLLERDCKIRVLAHQNSREIVGNLEALPASQRNDLEIVFGDIRDPFRVDQAVEGCEVVFHLAALVAIPYSYGAPHSYVETNVMGTLNLLEAGRKHGTQRFVHTSTSEVYGSASYVPMDERHPLQGQSPYSASKIAADQLVEAYHRSYDLPVAVLRPFNTFGPRQSAQAIIPAIVTQALQGANVMLGSLSPIRDFTFVEDTVTAFLAIAECDEAVGRVVNIGNGRGIAMGDLAARILRLMNREGRCRVSKDETRVRPSRSEVLRLVCDNTLARDLLKWEPTADLDEGLRRTIEYFTAHAHHSPREG